MTINDVRDRCPSIDDIDYRYLYERTQQIMRAVQRELEIGGLYHLKSALGSIKTATAIDDYIESLWKGGVEE